ncbi:MAG: FAD-dependent oxidoreductase [Acidimicrobiia bacterium]|nr:FAD-dependent oxidoreductase [Acidimicrobiia bacterium]
MSKTARVVIVGGGIVGAATAYELAVKHGWRDIVLIEQGDLPYNPGSTSHAPGGIVVAGHSQIMTRFAEYSRNLYAELSNIDDKHLAFNGLGGLEVARTEGRAADFKRLYSTCKANGIPTELLSPAEAVELVPYLDPNAFTAALFSPMNATVRGYHLVGDLLARAEATGGFEWHANTGLTDIEVTDGRVTAVLTNNAELPRIDCEHVVLAANIWSPALSEKIGVHIPLAAFEHQYAITPPLDEWSDVDSSDATQELRYPLVRDVDVTMYYRIHWDQLGIGSYYHPAHMVRSREVGETAMHPFTPEDMVDAWKLTQEIVPMMRDRKPEFETAYNGMFAFSVDAMPIIGESLQARGFWSANASWLTHGAGVAKSVAEWMVHGETEWDMRGCHLHRFVDFMTTEQYVDAVTQKNYREIYDYIHPKQPITEPRDVRHSAFHDRHVAAGASFTTFAGFELPNWYASNAPLVDEFRDQIPDRSGWEADFWSPIQGGEHLAIRDRAGLFDLSGLGIIEVSGAGALDTVQRLCSNKVGVPIGRVVYTLFLTPSGGVKRDLTVARMADEVFWLFVGEGTLPMDYEWVVRHATEDAVITDRSAAYSAVGLFGPAAKDILGSVTNANLDDFGFYRGRWIEVGMSRVFAMRISYVGESGWELHIPTESSLAVWEAITTAGERHGMVLAGMGAMDSMRLEKGYRLWGADVHTEHTPYEAGLGWTVRPNHADFIGRDSVVAAKDEALSKQLVCMTLENGTPMGYEPVLSGDEVVGYVTTGNMGYSVGTYIAYAYVDSRHATPGTELTVEYFAEGFPAVVVEEPLFDPEMKRMKA